MINQRFDFKVKANSKGLFVEGYANPNTFDRTDERIDPKGWALDNYKKNPIVLFNHGLDPTFGSLPIGKTVSLEAKDDGLYARVKISDSKTEKITAIRDLIEEGILKTFSVGFNPRSNEKVMTDCELIELSIVPIPAHQDAVFGICGKSLADNRSQIAKGWLDEYQARLELLKKRSYIALAFNNKMKELQSKGFHRDYLLNKLINKTKLLPIDIENILNGKNPITESLINDFCDVMLLNSDAIKSLENISNPYILLENVSGIKLSNDYEIIEIYSDKKNWDSQIEIETKLKNAGYSIEVNNHNDDKYVYVQKSIHNCYDKQNLVTIELDRQIFAIVGAKKMGDKACATKEEEKVKAEADMLIGMSDEDIKLAVEKYKKEAEACVNNEETNPAKWVADEAAWQKAKEVAAKAYSKDDPEKFFALVTWLYLHKFGGTIKQQEETESKSSKIDVEKKGVIGSGDNAVKQDELPPMIDLAKQTNILLTALLQEMQKVNLSIEKIVTPEQPKIISEVDEESSNDQAIDQKSLDSIVKRIRDSQIALSKRVEKILS
jgi:HK97 family phage prohead protease